jgi:tetratricopeptide (TPR) repeat protein
LLERNFEQSPTPLDRRAKAILLAMRPNAQHVVEAVQLLEEIAALGLNRTAEQLLLADLYYLAGSRELGRATLRGVLNGPTTASADAVTAISALITQHELSEADVWLTALARREPRHIGLLAQRARWLDGLRRSDEAVALLRNVLEVESAGVSADERRHLVVGTLDMMQWTEAAEQLYREATECGASVTDFAMWLGRRGRLDAALAAVRPLAERGEFASAAIAGAGVLVRADPSAEQIALVAEWQSRAAAQSETNMTKFGLALLRHAQGRHDDAADILRQLAATGMNPSVVLNDLAWIVGVELDRPAEALEHINEAIKQSGPEPHLLDTRGVVLTRLGRFADAIADLTESANAQPGINAGRYLNLARAYSLIGDADQARSALRKIDSARPGAGLVRAAQQAEFAALRAQLEK